MFLTFGVQRKPTKVRPGKNILYTILPVTSFLLSGWCDVKTQKSHIKVLKINMICVVNCTTNKKT